MFGVLRLVAARASVLRSPKPVMPTSTEPVHPGDDASVQAPPLPVLATSFLLAGLGTVVLGPLMPQLLHEWQLSDQRGGLLLLAKFVGAFAGGASVPSRLRLGILAGHLLAAVGFMAFALSHGLALALPALFLTGLGLGAMIASTNILAGRRWSEHAGSALSLLNFFWSLGAVSTGILVAVLLSHLGWRAPVGGLAVLLALTGVAYLPRSFAALRASFASAPYSAAHAQPGSTPVSLHLRPGLSLIHGGLLFLYGGLETCLTAWLTTFSLRFAGGPLLGGQSGFVILWAALTAGRVLATALLHHFFERKVQSVSLVLCFALVVLLSQVHSAAMLSLTCVLLGLALAPVFPSTFALLLRRSPPARSAGFLLALSGLGAAFFPWLMGAVSTHTGSLRLAMAVPAAIIPVMLLFVWRDTLQRPAFPPQPSASGAKIR